MTDTPPIVVACEAPGCDRPAVVRQPRRHLEVTSGGAWRCHLDHGDDVAEAAR